MLGWVTGHFGWLFVLASAAFLLFSAYLAVTRYGNIKLGPDDSEPEFSTFSWVSMMFATGMGIGLMFWGVAEPLTHLNAPAASGRAEPGTPEAAELAMEYTFFHWGFHPWAMYAVIGLAIGYFAYRKGGGNLVIRGLPSAPRRPGAAGPPARRSTWSRSSRRCSVPRPRWASARCRSPAAWTTSSAAAATASALAVAVIAVLTLCFVVSAVSGIEKGVKYLSNANAVAAVLLVFFLFVVGPTVFILGTFTESLGGYLTHLPTMASGPASSAASSWLSTWTIFYWAWWISWTPFVGHVHRADLEGPHDPAVRGLRDPGAQPGVVRVVLDHGGTAFDLQLKQG